MSTPDVHNGWQDQPDGRGTFDILKSCGGTIILLCWSSVCPNVPSTRSSGIRSLAQKFYLFLLAILGPDFILMTAMGQLEAAYNARSALRDRKLADWSLRQCFFLNMGGFHVSPAGWKSQAGQTSFAVNAAQMIALVDKGLLAMPEVQEEEINDRNKTDTLARAITIVQVVWFTAETFGRIGQGLAITTLELTTLAFIFLMSATSICWWRKPMDISTPIVLHLQDDLDTVLTRLEISSDKSLQNYMGTPLSSIGRDEWFLSQHWFYYTELLRRLGLAPAPKSPYEFDYFGSVDFIRPSIKFEVFSGPLILGYGAIFMAAWNFHFPTDTESLLWRIAAGLCLGFTVLGEGVAFLSQHGDDVAKWMQKQVGRESRADTGNSTLPSSKLPQQKMTMRRFRGFLERVRNLSRNNDPAMRIPLSVFIPTTLLCVMYCVSRLYILAEDLASLRSLPESAFQTVDWGQYSPIF